MPFRISVSWHPILSCIESQSRYEFLHTLSVVLRFDVLEQSIPSEKDLTIGFAVSYATIVTVRENQLMIITSLTN